MDRLPHDVREILDIAVREALRESPKEVNAVILYDVGDETYRQIAKRLGSNRPADVADWLVQGREKIAEYLPPRHDLY